MGGNRKTNEGDKLGLDKELITRRIVEFDTAYSTLQDEMKEELRQVFIKIAAEEPLYSQCEAILDRFFNQIQINAHELMTSSNYIKVKQQLREESPAEQEVFGEKSSNLPQ